VAVQKQPAITLASVSAQLTSVASQLAALQKGQTAMAANITTILAAQATEKADLATLVALVPQILTAVANGSFTPAQAQQVLAEMQSEDASIVTLNTSLQAALPATGGQTPTP
jgi:ATP-dependent exoDNAse (exonuclease V) alpha subunit